MTSRIWARLACIIVVSTFEVRVKANVIEHPKSCLQSTSDQCAVHVLTTVEMLDIAGGRLRLAKGASLVRALSGEVQLVRGTLAVNSVPGQEISIKTVFGDLKVDGGALIDATDSIIRFTSISGRLTYRPRGDRKDSVLPPGYTSYFAAITSTGVAEAGYPRLTEVERLVGVWSRTYSRDQKKEFLRELETFMPAWRSASLVVGSWYKETAERAIASAAEEAALRARRKAAEDAENAKLRNLFRKRVTEDFL